MPELGAPRFDEFDAGLAAKPICSKKSSSFGFCSFLTTGFAFVTLAAGLGSRYGSLKQIDKFGPSGETIVDYAIYDAIEAGFDKIVFVIRRSIEEEFKEIFLKKLTNRVEVEYVFQELD